MAAEWAAGLASAVAEAAGWAVLGCFAAAAVVAGGAAFGLALAVAGLAHPQHVRLLPALHLSYFCPPKELPLLIRQQSRDTRHQQWLPAKKTNRFYIPAT